MEDKRRLGGALDDPELEAFFAVAVATRGVAVVTKNTGEFRNTGVGVSGRHPQDLRSDPWPRLAADSGQLLRVQGAGR